MAVPDVQTVLARYKASASLGAQRYAEGVANTDMDPTQLAIAAGQRYIQRVTQAFNSGAWTNGLRRSGKAGWQSAVAAKGAANYSTGVQNADEKFTSAFSKLLPAIASLQSTIRNMPNVTDADRKARMNAWFDGLVGKSFKA